MPETLLVWHCIKITEVVLLHGGGWLTSVAQIHLDYTVRHGISVFRVTSLTGSCYPRNVPGLGLHASLWLCNIRLQCCTATLQLLIDHVVVW